MQIVSIDTIRTDGGTQPRAGLSAEAWFEDHTYINDKAWADEIQRQCWDDGYVAFIEKHPDHPEWGYVFHTLYHRTKGVMKKSIARYFERRNHPQAGWVYFLLSPTINRVKIGFETTKGTRAETHQTSCPEPLVLLGHVKARSMAEEKKCHEQWAHLRRHGEWFEATEELMHWIKEATAC